MGPYESSERFVSEADYFASDRAKDMAEFHNETSNQNGWYNFWDDWDAGSPVSERRPSELVGYDIDLCGAALAVRMSSVSEGTLSFKAQWKNLTCLGRLWEQSDEVSHPKFAVEIYDRGRTEPFLYLDDQTWESSHGAITTNFVYGDAATAITDGIGEILVCVQNDDEFVKTYKTFGRGTSEARWVMAQEYKSC